MPKITDEQIDAVAENYRHHPAVMELVTAMRQMRPPPIELAEGTFRQFFEEYWKPQVCAPDGSLDPDLVARNLADYAWLLRSVEQVYDALTGGETSNPFGMPDAIISLATEHSADAVMDGCADELHQVQQAVMRMDPLANVSQVLIMLRDRIKALNEARKGGTDDGN